jgi:ABC-2 type transport system ATP-binding protein
MSVASTEPAVTIRGLCKSYRWGFWRTRRHPALIDLSFSVPRGEIFGYLGPNGSGKTSTIKALVGLARADAGEITVLGRRLEDPAWRAQVGYLPETPYLYDYLTAAEYLEYAGRLFSLPRALRRERARALLVRVGLDGARDVPMRRYSKGMLQRAGLAQALINEPTLVILDEPMSGLDPLGRRLVRDLILELKAAGTTVFFSTHILSDAEALCDTVAVLRGGRLLAEGRLDKILDIDVSHSEVLVSGVGAEALARLPEAVVVADALRERHRLSVPHGHLAEVVGLVEREGGRVLSVQPIRQTLEEFFFKELGSAPEGAPWRPAD